MIRLILMVSVLGLVACGGDKKSEAKKETVTKAKDGEKCAKDGECASGRCSSKFKCLPTASAGAACSVPDDCSDGLTCSQLEICFDPTKPETQCRLHAACKARGKCKTRERESKTTIQSLRSQSL